MTHLSNTAFFVLKHPLGRAYTLANIKRTQIRLPTSKDGFPYWEFMENYIKSLPYSANI